jgi:hypothetical protein
MIFDEINSIVSEIEKAVQIQKSILLFSQEPHTIDRASKLSDVVSKLQANVVSIQSRYIQIMSEKKDLEEKLIKSDPCIKIVE